MVHVLDSVLRVLSGGQTWALSGLSEGIVSLSATPPNFKIRVLSKPVVIVEA